MKTRKILCEFENVKKKDLTLFIMYGSITNGVKSICLSTHLRRGRFSDGEDGRNRKIIIVI